MASGLGVGSIGCRVGSGNCPIRFPAGPGPSPPWIRSGTLPRAVGGTGRATSLLRTSFGCRHACGRNGCGSLWCERSQPLSTGSGRGGRVRRLHSLVGSDRPCRSVGLGPTRGATQRCVAGGRGRVLAVRPGPGGSTGAGRGCRPARSRRRPIPTSCHPPTGVSVSRWPVLDQAPVELPTLGDHENTLWDTLLELADLRPREWTLIGGQMVLVHATEAGVRPPRLSTDLDILVNARVVTGGVREFVRAIEGRGFVLAGASPQGLAHRYRRDRVSIDVLAPEGLGPRTDVTTTPPGHTVQVPGGTHWGRAAKHATLELLPAVYSIVYSIILTSEMARYLGTTRLVDLEAAEVPLPVEEGAARVVAGGVFHLADENGVIPRLGRLDCAAFEAGEGVRG